MTEVVLFHHVQGLTSGVLAFAEALRSDGHVVHAPDLFEGELPPTIEDGVAHVKAVGSQTLAERAARSIADLPQTLVYAGFSWGAATAQEFAQTRAGALGALLYEACLPITGEWAVGPWPDGVAVQIHGMDQDPFFALEGDLDAARALVASVGPERAELFVYPGDGHLFTDSSLQAYDAEATAQVLQRSREFLNRLG